MAIERVERLTHGLLVVALIGDREVLDPRQRAWRRIGRRPGVVGHGHQYAEFTAITRVPGRTPAAGRREPPPGRPAGEAPRHGFFPRAGSRPGQARDREARTSRRTPPDTRRA